MSKKKELKEAVRETSDLSELKGKAKGFLAAIGLLLASAVSGVLYGWFDYMAHPEIFRSGHKPTPPDRPAPGTAEVSSEELNAGMGPQVVTLSFVAGSGGISEDGGLKVGLCRFVEEDGARVPEPFLFNGWGILQNRRPRLPNYFTCEVFSSNPVRLEVEKKSVVPLRFFLRCCAREYMRHRGIKLESIDYRHLYLEYSKIKVRARDGRIEEGDRIIIELGDRGKGGPGWKLPAIPTKTEFLVEVDERALGIYRSIDDVPTIEIGEKIKKLRREFR
ncbi:MAG TPA: hypothetical protein VIK22_10935 [Candidatus Anoxymicrobiaceae bacterium]|jgi:hypothetical protein